MIPLTWHREAAFVTTKTLGGVADDFYSL
jgi:hypothetical protein